MKKIVFISTCILLSVLCFSSCVKMKFDDAENTSGSHFVLPENAVVMSVAKFLGTFPGELEQIPYPYVDEFTGEKGEVYLYVQVIGNDMSGNIYKNFYVRDVTENSMDDVRALNISVDKTGLYNFYPVGQKIYIRCSGLYIGMYNGLPQLGYIYNGGIGRMPDALFDSHVHKDGGVPELTSRPLPIEINSANELALKHLNQLVVLKDVHFKDEEVGLEFAPAPPVGSNPTSTDRTIIFPDNSEVTLRSSSASRFFSYTIPGGSGDVICIYTTYNGNSQMYLRSISDIKYEGNTFEWDAEALKLQSDTLINAKFNKDLAPFTAVSLLGDFAWEIATYNGNAYALMSGYSSETSIYEANEDWLISPKVDLTNAAYNNALALYFNQALNYKKDQPWDNFAVKVSSNYDPDVMDSPSEAQWDNLDYMPKPSGTNFNFTNSSVDLKAYQGKEIHVAFVYKSSGDASATGTWEINNVMLIGKKEIQ